MPLSNYNKKRNFNSTPEPKGKKQKSKSKKFVIQYHQARAKHYDFRLEHNGVLLSWAVPKGLSLNPKDKRLAVMVEDHPLDYINFEGIIPKGNYGAGSVQIYDSGTFEALTDLDKGLKKGHIKITLFGKKYIGQWSIVKLDDKNWLIIKSDDQFANLEKNTATRLPFNKCNVQLATLTNDIPTGKNWLFEIKYDGYRILAFVDKNKVRLITRNGQDYTKKFSSICKSLEILSQDNFVIDGEVVVFDKNGKTNFSLLQSSIKNGEQNFSYVVFDILALNGKDLRKLNLLKRKQTLETVLVKAKSNIIYSTHVIGKGKQCYKLAQQEGLEGIVAKNINSVYSGKRTEDWLKIKCYLRQEFVIAGYTTTDKNLLLSAILVGYYKDNKLIYVGKVGTGFNDNDKEHLNKLFSKQKQTKSQFVNCPKTKNTQWIKPIYVAEIQFTELTKDQILRQPSFIGLRTDKDPKDVKLEIANEY